MLTDLITILLLGILGYFISTPKMNRNFRLINVSLVVLLVVAAYIHSALLISIFSFRIYLSAALEGIIGGALVRRLSTSA